MAVNRSLSRHYTPYEDKQNTRPYMYPLVAGGVLLLAGLILYSTVVQMRIIPDYVTDLVLIVPSLFLFPVGILAWKGIIERKHCRIATTILLILGVLAIPMSAITSITSVYATPVEGAVYYEKTMQMLGADKNESFSAFPKQVPADAQDAQFCYANTQQHAGLELTFRTGEEMHAPLTEIVAGKAIWTGSYEEFAASEYAPALAQMTYQVPENATWYVLYVSMPEETGVLDGIFLVASADDGSMYYFYKVWTPN